MPKFSFFWQNHVRPAENLETLRERLRDVYKRIDEQDFGWKIVIVAGAGFLTDAYDIFAVNMVLPMLEIVYWKNNLPASQETAINQATLVGTIIGQLGFGILADRYGRKIMYGWELLIVIVSTVGLALCSKGAAGSVNILAWVVSWRILMGIGIGADYPLSAVIVSEFAPRKHRGRMLAAVFYMQPVGQLCANIITIGATAVARRYINYDADPSTCLGDCMETTDKIWRWIVGLGAVVPTIALLARLLIPESPRYLLEVEKDSHTAQENANKYFEDFEDPFQLPDEGAAAENLNLAAGNESNFASLHEFALPEAAIPLETFPQTENQAPDDGLPLNVGNGRIHVHQMRDSHVIETDPPPSTSTEYVTTTNADAGEETPNGGSTMSSPGKTDAVVEINSTVPSIILHPRNNTHHHEQHNPARADNMDAEQDQDGRSKTLKASWREFWKGFRDFLFNPNWHNIPEIDDHDTNNQTNSPDEALPAALPRHRLTDGNWTDLAGTSASWFLLDFSYYFLGVNSWKVIAKIWDTPVYISVYQLIIQFSWRALVSVSVSAMIGGALFIMMASYRHNLQMYGFLVLAAFLMAVGAAFVTLLGGRYFAAIIVLYFFNQLFFDFGPNTSTFIIPAEVFPTQYRATCHGISAAFGKLGSIFAQVIAQVYLNDNRSKRLGVALIIFSVLMILGAYITRAWVPNPCDIYGESRSLADLSKGKKERRKIETKERQDIRTSELARYGHV